MPATSDLQQPIPTSSSEIEQPFQNDSGTEASNVLKATKYVVAGSSDMPSPSSVQNGNSNINGETTSQENNLDQNSQDDRTSTEVPRRSQLNQPLAVETEPPSPSKPDNASLSGSEACVQVGATDGPSVPLKANPDTTEASPRTEETGQWYEVYRSEPNIWLGHVAKEPQCAFTIVKRKYTFSSMLIYMIMTTIFSRLYFLNTDISNLTTCSSHQELLFLNGACLFMLFVSLTVQLILDSFNVHTRSSCIVILGMFTTHFMLLLLMFGRVSYCQGSILDYVFPTLTLIACTGYATVAVLTVPKLLQ